MSAIALSLVGLVFGGSGDRVGDPCGICEAARVVVEGMSYPPLAIVYEPVSEVIVQWTN